MSDRYQQLFFTSVWSGHSDGKFLLSLFQPLFRSTHDAICQTDAVYQSTCADIIIDKHLLGYAPSSLSRLSDGFRAAVLAAWAMASSVFVRDKYLPCRFFKHGALLGTTNVFFGSRQTALVTRGHKYCTEQAAPGAAMM